MLVRHHLPGAKRGGRDRRNGPVLIDALLDAGSTPLVRPAIESGASNHQWLTLADRIRNSRPTDALPVYLHFLEPLKEPTGDAAYQQLTPSS
ncbi:hypothetical protein ACH4OW_32850 [Streptomyces sp. NPDC017056]|uniref:hypothetical protein n=1 Tax=Streptomyces sp. NPDC017056 TaxID=3364973 RepID=UPI0037AAECD5